MDMSGWRADEPCLCNANGYLYSGSDRSDGRGINYRGDNNPFDGSSNRGWLRYEKLIMLKRRC